MNTRMRTWILLAGLSALFVGVGGLVGGTGGIAAFLVLALAFNFAMYWFSDRLALKMSRARPLEPGEAPELVIDVQDLATRARIPVPRLYLIPSQQPNAFATGRDPKHSAVAVTEGLISLMPRDQVRAVVAHELAHIRNRDVLVTTIAAMIGAAISAVANFLQFQWLFGGDDDDSPLGAIGTIAAIIVAPLAAMLLQLAISRQREYLADHTAAELLGRDEVEPRHREPGPLREILDIGDEIGLLALLERPRAAHLQREPVREPEHREVEADGDDEEQGDPARASDEAADRDEERGKACQQDPGAHARCHRVFRVLSADVCVSVSRRFLPPLTRPTCPGTRVSPQSAVLTSTSVRG